MIILGQILKEERLKKNFTLEKIEKELKIKSEFLLAIENGEYSKLPKGAYVAGFVRNYIQFLELPQEKLMALFRREFNEEKAFNVLPQGLPKKEEFPISQFKIKSSFVFVFLLFLILFGFIFYQYRFAFLNPPLEIFEPKENQILLQREVIISGKTDPNITLLIEDKPVSLEDNGNFKKTLSLFPGKKIITIKAVNKFGKETIVKRKIEISY